MTEQFITLVFKDTGYRVAKLFDDKTVYQISPDGKGNCLGFGVNIHDHNDCPFNHFFREDVTIKNNMHSSSCRKFSYDYFDHFISFVNADSKKPKFMAHMVLDIGHDNPVHAEVYNQYFYEGFRNNTGKVGMAKCYYVYVFFSSTMTS